ncbi:hypothetical protein [Myxacorys almedinensis]|uniref:Uncharacterized protein n=1 Tax=Myxacorys almedinensis A TaxID=2690445 RepID=A0A8J8CKF6_9CYAN|nr:hypothetical protein [Myxacorys almedinensis]NDJ16595.1 hypothetical protein [Myxacorys almedinensis A]
MRNRPALTSLIPKKKGAGSSDRVIPQPFFPIPEAWQSQVHLTTLCSKVDCFSA